MTEQQKLVYALIGAQRCLQNSTSTSRKQEHYDAQRALQEELEALQR